MAELMIAIVILGIGLLMAAVMFPVAWTRARELAEFTSQSTAANSAETTLRLLTKVQSPTDATPAGMTSFLGDYAPMGVTAITSSRFVQPLHMENAYADRGVVTGGDNFDTWGELHLKDFDPMSTAAQADQVRIVNPILNQWLTNSTMPLNPPPPQVAFHERFLPPLPARPDVNGPPDNQWDARLASRRFAWSALHRLQNFAEVTSPTAPRVMTFYVFTLRLSGSGQRFARQDDQDLPPTPNTMTAAPRALAASEDMQLPVPWLVSLQVLGNWDPVTGVPNADPRGVPSDAIANPELLTGGELIARMIQPGSVLVERITGSIFTAKRTEFIGDGNNYDQQARITLDREVLASEFWNGNMLILGAPGSPASDQREFWVFPPPVDRGATEDDEFPFFDGQQPVVGIEVRQMVFTP